MDFYEHFDHPRYCFRLTRDVSRTITIKDAPRRVKMFEGEFVSIHPMGNDRCVVTTRKGYAWNGATGLPEFLHSDAWISESLLHDPLYQLIRLGVLPRSARKEADCIFYEGLVFRGVWRLIAGGAYCLVRTFGGYFI